MKFKLVWNGDAGFEDENIFAFKIFQKEGYMAKAFVQLETKNLPAFAVKGQKKSLFVASLYGLSIREEKLQKELLFKGTLLSLPQNPHEGLSTIILEARHPQWEKSLEDLHKKQRAGPFWDPLFVKEEEISNPRESLEAQGALYCWSRTDGGVQTSDLFWGRKSLNIGKRFFKDSLKVTQKTAPLKQVKVVLRTQWLQRYEGVLNLTAVLRQALPGGLLSSLTGTLLRQSWWRGAEKKQSRRYWIKSTRLKEITPPKTGPLGVYPRSSRVFWVRDPSGILADSTDARFPLCFKRAWFKPFLTLGWRYQQRRQEIVKFTVKNPDISATSDGAQSRTLHLNLQNIVGENHHWRPHHIYTKGFRVVYKGGIYRCIQRHKTGNLFNPDLWQKVRANGHVADQASRATFFTTDRGVKAVEHAMNIARSHLAASARSYRVTFKAPFDALKGISLDHNVILKDPRLPRGGVKGKVVDYALMADGQSGFYEGQVTLAVAGDGLRHPENPENETTFKQAVKEITTVSKSFAPGYMVDSFQGRSPLTYDDFSDQTPRTGLSNPATLRAEQLVESLRIHHEGAEQDQLLSQGGTQAPQASKESILRLLRNHPTRLKLRLKDINGVEMLTHHIQIRNVSPCLIPQQWGEFK